MKLELSVVDIYSVNMMLDKFSDDRKAAVWAYLLDRSDTKARWLPERKVKTLSAKIQRKDTKFMATLFDLYADKAPQFKLCLSNPPYQRSTKNDGSNSAQNIYHHFMQVGQAISDNVSMVYPAKWLLKNGNGKGLSDFADNELNSRHYHSLFFFDDAKKFFYNTKFHGGLSFFLWDRNKTGGKVRVYRNNVSNYVESDVLAGKSGVFSYNDLSERLIDKVATRHLLVSIVSARNPYKLKSNFLTKNPQMIVSPEDTDVRLVTRGGVFTPVSRKCVSPGVVISDYKVFVSAMSATGFMSNMRPIVANPGDTCTCTYLRVGSFATRDEAEHCAKYLRTTFANALVGIVCSTHQRSRKAYVAVPLVDFATGEIKDKPGVFLDFEQDLDAQLRTIYDISDEEWEFMTTIHRPSRK